MSLFVKEAYQTIQKRLASYRWHGQWTQCSGGIVKPHVNYDRKCADKVELDVYVTEHIFVAPLHLGQFPPPQLSLLFWVFTHEVHFWPA
jgi:hypothetical protein